MLLIHTYRYAFAEYFWFDISPSHTTDDVIVFHLKVQPAWCIPLSVQVPVCSYQLSIGLISPYLHNLTTDGGVH